jgi:hypothetical protein
MIGIVLPLLMLALSALACDLEQPMGSISVDAERTSFTVDMQGEDYLWQANVIPGVKYELIILPSEQPRADRWGKNEIHLRVNGAEDCGDCVLFLDGPVVVEGAILIFIGPEDGSIGIRAVFRGDTRNFTIQLREVSA